MLDWEFARAGCPLADAAVFLRHVGHWPGGVDEAFARGFVEGGGALPQRWRAIAELLDLRNLCGILNASKEHKPALKNAGRQIAETVEKLESL